MRYQHQYTNIKRENVSRGRKRSQRTTATSQHKPPSIAAEVADRSTGIAWWSENRENGLAWAWASKAKARLHKDKAKLVAMVLPLAIGRYSPLWYTLIESLEARDVRTVPREPADPGLMTLRMGSIYELVSYVWCVYTVPSRPVPSRFVSFVRTKTRRTYGCKEFDAPACLWSCKNSAPLSRAHLTLTLYTFQDENYFGSDGQTRYRYHMECHRGLDPCD